MLGEGGGVGVTSSLHCMSGKASEVIIIVLLK